MNIKRSIARNLFLLLIGVGLLCTMLYFFIFKTFAEMRPAAIFPLNDIKGEYTVFRTSVDAKETKVWQYWLSYKGKLVVGNEGYKTQATIPIGHSNVNLEKLMGTYQSQRIRVKGYFGKSYKQCILSTCIPLSSYSLLNVVNIMEVIE